MNKNKLDDTLEILLLQKGIAVESTKGPTPCENCKQACKACVIGYWSKQLKQDVKAL